MIGLIKKEVESFMKQKTKQKWKKVGAFSLSCAMAIGCLSGCGKTSSNDSQKEGEISGEVRYAFWDSAQQPYFEKCIEKFNEKYPDVKIKLEPSSWDEYWTKLEAGATGGSIADVFWMNGPNIIKYADGDILMDIGSQMKESGIDPEKYPDDLIDLYNVDGKQYAIPKDYDTIGVWYNKKLFDEAGVPYPTEDWTWDDMVDIAKQLTKADGSVYGISAEYQTHFGIYNTIPADGGYVISDDKKKSGYNKEETQAGVQRWVDLIKEGASPSQASLEETSGGVQFLSGRLGMYWCGSWFLAQVVESDKKNDIDVVSVPSINGNKTSVIHGLGNCIYKDTKNPEAAWKWVEFLSGEEANKLSAESGAAIPAYEGTANIWGDKYKEYNLASFIKAAEDFSVPYPASKNSAEWEQYQAEELKKAFNLKKDVKDACEEVAKKMNEVLASE